MLLQGSFKLVSIEFMQYFPGSNHFQHRSPSHFAIAKNHKSSTAGRVQEAADSESALIFPW